MRTRPLPTSDEDISPLLICEAANPEWTSVPLEGWSHSRAIADITRAHRITQIRNREAFLRAGIPEDRFTAIDSEAVARTVRRVGERMRGGDNRGWTTLQALSPISYAWFEHLVWKHFGESIKRGDFDVVHRITPLSPTTPSSLASRCAAADVPFVLGPLNGGVPWPRAFDRERRREREWLSYLREGYRTLPGYRTTRRHASAIICGSLDTLEQMPTWCRDRCIYIPENAIDPERFARADSFIKARQPPLPLRLSFVGRLVPYKGADMLIEAATPLLRKGVLELDIIGDGPERTRLQEIIRREDLGHAVHLKGWIEHTKLQEALAEAHIFAFPSIREFGGAVILEAMALGLIPVVVDYGGPGELVTTDTGFRVPIGDRETIISSFRQILTDLADQAASSTGIAELGALAARGRTRTLEHFTWDAKAHQVREVYRWVLGLRDKPDFTHLLDPASQHTRIVAAATPVEQPAPAPA